ncbi:erythromycin esterase [Murinocardiopsis flavida]|uniref:Erythromycin esterase n=1 Tax=Murinocardiopsis flavida TaxID=645275 RepID=A0A2P8DFD1_9ACTN|nr:erythromycin esterase family protein [Murinocardiopsis flavida]PSK95920.1 erythromycin esterase [Murinocardiopsis flavida]
MTDLPDLATWVRDHAFTAETLDPSAPLDDLEPLRALVGDARVVAIGESSHLVKEFYLFRHRMLRFLAERCGFTVLAFEAPFTEAHAVDSYVRGGPGTAAAVAAEGIAMGLGDCAEMHDLLDWMREYNRTAAVPLGFAGLDVPGSLGSPLPALHVLDGYVRWAEPDALGLVERATELAGRFHGGGIAPMEYYSGLPQADRDELTVLLSRLLSRVEIAAAAGRGGERRREHSSALHHLRGAWKLDHAHREIAEYGIESASSTRDAFLAESVLRLLDEGGPDTRVVVACHNWHIQRTEVEQEGPYVMRPQGNHLAAELGNDYVAIGVTSGTGDTGYFHGAPETPLGFEFRAMPLPPPEKNSIEAAFDTRHPLAVADLRAARGAVRDGDSVRGMRMVEYFLDLPVMAAFDAVAHVAQTHRATPGAPAPG